MPRVKRGKVANKKREALLKYTKGFMWGRKSKERAAKEALLHAWTNMFRGRKEKKRNFRSLWQVKISAGARANDLNYSTLISGLKKNKIELNRKMLADIAENEPNVFKQIAEEAKK
jgi:large subunit ribosomal protein L20